MDVALLLLLNCNYLVHLNIDSVKVALRYSSEVWNLLSLIFFALKSQGIFCTWLCFEAALTPAVRYRICGHAYSARHRCHISLSFSC